MVVLLTGHKCSSFGINWLFFQVQFASTMDLLHHLRTQYLVLLLFHWVVHVVESLLCFLGPKCDFSQWSKMLRCERYIYQKERSDLKNLDWKTGCPYTNVERPLVENYFVVVSDVLLLPGMETGIHTFKDVLYRGEDPQMAAAILMALHGATESSNLEFTPFGRKMGGLLLIIMFSIFPRFFKFFTSSRTVARAESLFRHLFWKFLPPFAMDCM